MDRRIPVPLAAALALSALHAGAGETPDADARRAALGAEAYRAACASCHGLGGEGDGPVAALLTVAPPDLTALSEGNRGSFPFDRVYRVIDGRVPVPGHGPSAMPVWGRTFRSEAVEQALAMPRRPDPELLVAGRILVLIDFLMSIQKD